MDKKTLSQITTEIAGERAELPTKKGSHMPNQNETRYALMHQALNPDYGIALTARTDLGARRQAKQIAKREGLRGYWITFYRAADGCRGAIEVAS